MAARPRRGSLLLNVPPVRVLQSLCRPRARRSQILVIAAVLEVGRLALFPSAVLPVLPAVLGVDRIVAETPGVVRIRGVEPCGLVVCGVVVAEIVVLILRPQEEIGWPTRPGRSPSPANRRNPAAPYTPALKYTGANSTPRRPME